jgi:hypothetical protein
LLHRGGGVEEWLREAEEREFKARLKGSKTKTQFGPDTPVTIAMHLPSFLLSPRDLKNGRIDLSRLSRSTNISALQSLIAKYYARHANYVHPVRIKQFIVDDFKCFSAESWDVVIRRFREHLKAKGYDGQEPLYKQSSRNRNPRPTPTEKGSGGWGEIFAAVEAIDCGTLLKEKSSAEERRTISLRLKRPRLKPNWQSSRSDGTLPRAHIPAAKTGEGRCAVAGGETILQRVLREMARNAPALRERMET